MPKLEFKNISLSYGSSKILHDVNFSVNEGEFIVLVGPSGSGKSTILRTIAGLERQTEGSIYLEGKSIDNLSPKERDISMVFQNYALYPHLTVFDNLAFPLMMRKVKTEEITSSVSNIAELLHIEKHLKKKPMHLSGGERQRVALGRAIIRKPKLFLMDEPLSNLDAKLRTTMRTEILKLHKTFSSTVLYVTHDQIEALTMGDKILVLHQGKVQQFDTPANIYNNPSNIYVAGFIGTPQINFFDLKIIDSTKIEISGVPIENQTLVDKFLAIIGNLSNEREFILGIRPDFITQGNDLDFTFEANVEIIEMLGSEFFIHTSVLNSKNTYPVSMKTFNKPVFKAEDVIKLTFSLKNALLFSKSTEKLIKSNYVN